MDQGDSPHDHDPEMLALAASARSPTANAAWVAEVCGSQRARFRIAYELFLDCARVLEGVPRLDVIERRLEAISETFDPTAGAELEAASAHLWGLATAYQEHDDEGWCTAAWALATATSAALDGCCHGAKGPGKGCRLAEVAAEVRARGWGAIEPRIVEWALRTRPRRRRGAP